MHTPATNDLRRAAAVAAVTAGRREKYNILFGFRPLKRFHYHFVLCAYKCPPRPDHRRCVGDP